LNPHLDGRRVEDTGRSCLTSRTSYSSVYNIEYILYLKAPVSTVRHLFIKKVPTFLPNQLSVKH
jgi:hypothetical protein